MLVRLGLSVCLCPFLIACGGGGEAQTASESASLSLTPLPLFPDDPGRTRLGDLRYLGGVALDLDDERFGLQTLRSIPPRAPTPRHLNFYRNCFLFFRVACLFETCVTERRCPKLATMSALWFTNVASHTSKGSGATLHRHHNFYRNF